MSKDGAEDNQPKKKRARAKGRSAQQPANKLLPGELREYIEGVSLTHVNFNRYVELYCGFNETPSGEKVDVKKANEYAENGRLFLSRLEKNQLTDEDKTQQGVANNMAYLNWYLLKSSFDEGVPIGKGTFTLSLNSNELTENLYQYLKNERDNLFSEYAANSSKVRSLESASITAVSPLIMLLSKKDKNPTYSRTSSHFNKRLKYASDGHYGIDSKFSEVPLPWKFQTSCFGLCEEPGKDGNTVLSMYIKPETQGADILRDFSGTVKHGFNFLKAIYSEPDSQKGLVRKAESKFTETDFQVIKKYLDDQGIHLKEKPKNFDHLKKVLRKSIRDNDYYKDLVNELNAYLLEKYYNSAQLGNEQKFYFNSGGISSKVEYSQSKDSEPSTPSQKGSNTMPGDKRRRNAQGSNTIRGGAVFPAIASIINAEFGESIPLDGSSAAKVNLPLSGVNVSYTIFDQNQKDPYETTSQIYSDRTGSIFKAGEDLIKELVSQGMQQKYLDDLENLKARINNQLSSLDPGNESDHKRAVDLIAEATKETATILSVAESNGHVVDPTTAQNPQAQSSVVKQEDWLKVLQDKEFSNLSTKQRDVLINAYPDGNGGYLISYAKPLSNTSCLSRAGQTDELPNFWKAVSIHVDAKGNVLSQRELYRSASVTPFEIKDKDERLKKAKIIAQFEMRAYAEEKIRMGIANGSIRTQEDLNNALKFDFMNLSLQSTIGLEYRSINEGSRIYQTVAKEGVNFTDQQVAIINKLLADKGTNLSLSSTDKIEPNLVFLNLGTNILRGDDPAGLQGKLNKQAKIALQNKLLEKINAKFDNGKNWDLFRAVELLNKKNPINADNLKKLNAYIELNKDNPAIAEEVKSLRLFVEFSKLNIKGQQTSVSSHLKNQSKDNFLQQESAVALAENLGFIVKAQCQSGKDRTGMFFASVEAAQIERDYQTKPGPVNKDVFWDKYLPNSVQYTAGRAITSVNCPGASGFQAQNVLFVSPNGFVETIGAERQDRSSKLHKSPYIKNNKKVTNLESKRGMPSVVPMIANALDSATLPPARLIQYVKEVRKNDIQIKRKRERANAISKPRANALGATNDSVDITRQQAEALAAKREFEYVRQLLKLQQSIDPDIDSFKLNKSEHGDLEHSFICFKNSSGNFEVFRMAKDILGKGMEGKTKIIENEKGEQFAVKISAAPTDKNTSKKDEEFAMMTEVGLLIGSFVREKTEKKDKVLNKMIGNKLYTLMPYIPGKELAAVLKERELSASEKAFVLQKMLECAAFIHDKNIIHRDIKPENMMVSFDEKGVINNVTFIDYGESLKSDAKITAPYAGSPAFMAPELNREKFQSEFAKHTDLNTQRSKITAQKAQDIKDYKALQEEEKGLLNSFDDNDDKLDALKIKMNTLATNIKQAKIKIDDLTTQMKTQEQAYLAVLNASYTFDNKIDMYAIGILAKERLKIDLSAVGLNGLLENDPDKRLSAQAALQILQPKVEQTAKLSAQQSTTPTQAEDKENIKPVQQVQSNPAIRRKRAVANAATHNIGIHKWHSASLPRQPAEQENTVTSSSTKQADTKSEPSTCLKHANKFVHQGDYENLAQLVALAIFHHECGVHGNKTWKIPDTELPAMHKLLKSALAAANQSNSPDAERLQVQVNNFQNYPEFQGKFQSNEKYVALDKSQHPETLSMFKRALGNSKASYKNDLIKPEIDVASENKDHKGKGLR